VGHEQQQDISSKVSVAVTVVAMSLRPKGQSHIVQGSQLLLFSQLLSVIGAMAMDSAQGINL
jgi:hypothetical protein